MYSCHDKFKWTSDVIEFFLRNYFLHPCLWDPNHKHYLNNYAHFSALEEMSNAMKNRFGVGMDPSFILATLDKLAIIVSREVQKMVEHAVIMKPYSTKLPWFVVGYAVFKYTIKIYPEGFNYPDWIYGEYMSEFQSRYSLTIGEPLHPVPSTEFFVKLLNWYDEYLSKQPRKYPRTFYLEKLPIHANFNGYYGNVI